MKKTSKHLPQLIANHGGAWVTTFSDKVRPADSYHLTTANFSPETLSHIGTALLFCSGSQAGHAGSLTVASALFLGLCR